MADTGAKNDDKLVGKDVHLRAPLKTNTIGSYQKKNTGSSGSVNPFTAIFMKDMTFGTKKRHPFVWPCDTCLHRGFTRTYVIRNNFYKEILANLFVAIIMYIGMATTSNLGMIMCGIAAGICTITTIGFIHK